MDTIRAFSTESLKTAHADLVRARRALPVAAGVLVLIHLLTVHPYLTTRGQIAGLETAIDANAALAATLGPEIQKLKAATRQADKRIADLLERTSLTMIDRFGALRDRVSRALTGDIAPPSAASAPPHDRTAQPRMPQMQMPQVQMPQSTADMRPAPRAGEDAERQLSGILAIVRTDPAAASDRLSDWARVHIVKATYDDAQAEWDRAIRPDYLAALRAAGKSARAAAASAPESAAEIAKALARTSDDIEKRIDAVGEIAIRHDQALSEALGFDWWKTEGGKLRNAELVVDRIGSALADIANRASRPTETLHAALELQNRLRADLAQRQKLLETQFADQRARLAGLSGAGEFIPVDLEGFVGLFPLVIGLVMGVMLLRAGQARHEAATAAADLARASPAPEDEAVRTWISQRMIGGSAPFPGSLATVAPAGAVVAWILLAAVQVAGSPARALIAPWTGAAVAVALVAAAAGWEVLAVRKLRGAP